MARYFHNISVIVLRIADKFFRFFNCICFYENKYGIKDFAFPSFLMNNESEITIVDLNPADVYLSFDGLKNQYTLIEKPISESPHVELIRLINEGKDISECDYLKREINGFLDHRDKQFIGERLINNHLEKNKIINKDRLPLVYRIEDKYYIIDGKHRFASAFLSGDEAIRCKEVSCKEIAKWDYICKLYSVIKNNKHYSKQINHIEKIMHA